MKKSKKDRSSKTFTFCLKVCNIRNVSDNVFQLYHCSKYIDTNRSVFVCFNGCLLLKLDLQKGTAVLDNPPNEKFSVYKKGSIYQKNREVLFCGIYVTIGQCVCKYF